MPSNERQENDPWLYKEPRTSEQLAEERAKCIENAAQVLVNPPTEFTCDKCGLAGVCTLVFDSYNTNGDCLYDK